MTLLVTTCSVGSRPHFGWLTIRISHLKLSDTPLSICPRFAQGITARIYQARQLQHLLTHVALFINRCTDYRLPVRNHQDVGTPIHVRRRFARQQCLHRRGRHHRCPLFHLFGEHILLVPSPGIANFIQSGRMAQMLLTSRESQKSQERSQYSDTSSSSVKTMLPPARSGGVNTTILFSKSS